MFLDRWRCTIPGVYRRKGRNGKPSRTWTAWWINEDGRKIEKAAGRDKATAETIAKRNDSRCRLVREGVLDRSELAQQVASSKPVAAHVEDYRLALLAKGDKSAHARDTAHRLVTLLEDAGVVSVADLAPDRVLAALGRLRQRRSPRTTNAALVAVKAWARWLAESNRIREVPRGLASLKRYSQEVDRVRVRRALTPEEFERLIRRTEEAGLIVTRKEGRGGKPVGWLTGHERAALYRLAAGTGFRANELRSLTRESFELGDKPVVVCSAGYSKRKRTDRQPIRPDLAEVLRPFVEATEPGQPVFAVPEKTAEMLKADMERAGIPYEVNGKVADFHALRGLYVTGLWLTCSNPVVVQRLARHSDLKLTTNVYTSVDDEELRRAIEGEGK